MAYMCGTKGPYPNKAGEFCGNYPPTCHLDAKSRYRLGRPHSCKIGTSEELAANGWFGLYLKKDDPQGVLLSGCTEIPTPSELMEPGP